MANDTAVAAAPANLAQATGLQTPTGGGIGSSASDSNPTGQPPRTVPGVQQIPNQEPMKGLGGRLRGVLYGLATGGIPGAVEGAIAPNVTRTHFQQSEAMRQARTDEAATEATFSSARSAEAVARASMADFQYQHMDEDRQLAVTQQNLQIAKMAQDAGFQIRAVTSMDQGPEANAQSAMNNIADIKKSDGTIPEMLHLHVGDKVLSLQPINPTAGLNLVNKINRAQGKPTISSDEFLSLPKNVQQGMTLDAINFADPGNGVINGDTLSTLQGRLNLIKAQPDFEGKGQLQTILENAVKTHSAVVGYANTRLAQQKAEQMKILGAQETANKVADIKATSGPEAQAAGARAYAERAAQNKADMEALGGTGQDAFGEPIEPPAGGVKEYNKVKDSFKKDADGLAQTEQTFRQFGSVLSDINAGKDITGAQSVVGLFNAIGISAEPLKGKGFRINNNTVAEHATARGLGQSLYQKFLSLKDGDVITPQQLKDYATIAMNARRDAYVTKFNEARSQGINPDFLLPRGNGQRIDPSTASIFLELAAGDKNKARIAAKKSGWNF